jgi:hypothetical protein
MNYCEAAQYTNSQPICLICHDNYNINSMIDNKIVKITDCSHIYHKECIEKWFEYNESCPLCRKPLAPQINLIQCLLLFLSFSQQQQQQQQQQPTSPRSHDSTGLQTYEIVSLSQIAFTTTFLHVILERFKAPAEYNNIRERILNLKNQLCIDEQRLPDDLNLKSRTAAMRELKHRQILLRSQLVQWLWTQSDPYHMNDPPRLHHGRRMFSHPYLENWKQKINTEINGLL